MKDLEKYRAYHREYQRRWRLEHPEEAKRKEELRRLSGKTAESVRKVYYKMKADPEKWEAYKEQRREWMRRYRLRGFKGKVQKRERPRNSYCELCGRDMGGVLGRFHYHHWDNEHPEWGMWICSSCHNGVEKYERGLIDKYLVLKTRITGGLSELKEVRMR